MSWGALAQASLRYRHRTLPATRSGTLKIIFFTAEMWSLRGLVTYHILFIIKLAKRTELLPFSGHITVGEDIG
jgi:hypothetical protein